MNKQEYLEFHKNFCNQMIEITAKKNSDYTGTNPSPFSNFEKTEQLGICSTEQGFLVRLLDKVSRIISFVQKGVLEVAEETVTDACIDGANYLCLFAAYIQSKRNTPVLVEVDNTELNEVDKDVLKLLNVDSGYWEDHIFEAFRSIYTARAIVKSLDKLLQLNKISIDDNDVYHVI
jgi:hypothetical protein